MTQEEVGIKKRDVVPLACLWGFWKVAEELDDLVLLFVLLLQGANCTTFNTYYASYYLISSSSVGVFQGFMSGAVVDVISDCRLDRLAMCVFVLLQFLLLGLEFYPFEGYYPAVRDHEYVYSKNNTHHDDVITSHTPPFSNDYNNISHTHITRHGGPDPNVVVSWDWRMIVVTTVWVSKWLVMTMSSNQIWKIVKIVAEDCAHRDYTAAARRNSTAAVPMKKMGGGSGSGGSVCRALEEADVIMNELLHGSGGGDGDGDGGDDVSDDVVIASNENENENENENGTMMMPLKSHEGDGDEDDDDDDERDKSDRDYSAKKSLLQNDHSSNTHHKDEKNENNLNDNNNDDDDDEADGEHNSSFYVQEFSSSVGAWGEIIADSTSLFATAFVALTPYFYFSPPVVPTDTWVSTWAQFTTALYPVLAILTICHVVSLLLLMFVIVIPYEYFESKRDTPNSEEIGAANGNNSEKGEKGLYSFYASTYNALSALGVRIADGLIKFWGAKIALYCMIHSLLVFALDSIIAYALALKVSSNDENLSLDRNDRHQWNLCGGLVSNLAEYDAMVCVFHLVGDFVYAILLVNMPLPRFYTVGYTTIAAITVVCMSLLIFGHISMIWKALMVACSSVALFFAVNYGYYGFSAYSNTHSFGIALQIYRVVEVFVELVVGFFMLAGTAEIYLFAFISLFLVITVMYGFYLAWWVFPHELQLLEDTYVPNGGGGGGGGGEGGHGGDDESK